MTTEAKDSLEKLKFLSNKILAVIGLAAWVFLVHAKHLETNTQMAYGLVGCLAFSGLVSVSDIMEKALELRKGK